MVNIILNNQTWPCPESWDEISIARTINLSRVVQAQERLIGGNGQVRTSTPISSQANGLSSFYRGIVSAAVGNSLTECTVLELSRLEEVVLGPLATILKELTVGPFYQSGKMSGFLLDGERVEFPRSGTDMAGAKTAGCGLDAGHFCDASELYSADRIGYAAEITAIICLRPQSPDEIISAKKIRELPMSVGWESLAVVAEMHRYMKSEFPECYTPRGGHNWVTAPEGVFAAGPGWSDLPFIVSGFSASELEAVRKMNCYDFMKMLSLGIRTGFYQQKFIE